ADGVSVAPAAGWYADPAGSSALRWWDGGGWTSALRQPVPATQPVAEPPPFGAPRPAPAATAVPSRAARTSSPGVRVALAASVVGVLAVLGWLGAGALGHSLSRKPDQSASGQAQGVALESDVLSIAQAEE